MIAVDKDSAAGNISKAPKKSCGNLELESPRRRKTRDNTTFVPLRLKYEARGWVKLPYYIYISQGRNIHSSAILGQAARVPGLQARCSLEMSLRHDMRIIALRPK